MIKDDRDCLIHLKDVVEYQITCMPDNRWHAFFFDKSGKTHKLPGSHKFAEDALIALKAIIEDS